MTRGNATGFPFKALYAYTLYNTTFHEDCNHRRVFRDLPGAEAVVRNIELLLLRLNDGVDFNHRGFASAIADLKDFNAAQLAVFGYWAADLVECPDPPSPVAAADSWQQDGLYR
jgi:hypothetical protein